MRLEYSVKLKDFLQSMKAYRRRAKGNAFVYYLDVWFLPILGTLIVIWYLLARVEGNEELAETLSWLAVVGLVAATVLPLIYHLKLRQAYKLRTALSPSGRVSLEISDDNVQFHIPGKTDVIYRWDALTDYSDEKDVITLFVQKAAFHTVPRRDINDADWMALQQHVSSHLRKI